MMEELERGKYAAIYADPPWAYLVWSAKGPGRSAEQHYDTMTEEDICALPVADIAAKDCALFLWVTWPTLQQAMRTIERWGFTYKTCAFAWVKADVSTIDLFPDPKDADMKLGHWTRSNSEMALLATRGNPKRLNADVRQGIIEPGRQHSRKPTCVYDRIERLVAGPYLELFARTQRAGWDAWGNEVGKFKNAI
jgi:N6-adenosine-specific RNA methylase IME4